MDSIELVERQADADGDALMSPVPGVRTTSLRDDPDYVKCPRCWVYHPIKDNYDGLCDKCCHTLVTGWPNHESVPHIKQSFADQLIRYSR